MEKDYIVRLRYAKCSMGTMENKLNCPLDHGIVFGEEEQPILNANDHISQEHIINFGTCTSPTNPGGGVKEFFKNPLKFITNGISGLFGSKKCECVPKTVLPWVNVKEDHVIEGAPALTSESKLACFYGGIISISPLPDSETEAIPK